MARQLSFSGVAGSYDASAFMATIQPVVAPFTPYVQVSADGSRLTVDVPDLAPLTLDAQIAQLAAMQAYENTLKKERTEQEHSRRTSRKTEKLAAVRHILDDKAGIPSRRPGDTDQVLEIFYDILKDME